MKSFLIIPVFIFLLTLWIQLGYGLQCYNCNSFYNEGCGLSLSNSSEFVTTCSDTDKGCRKVVQKIKVKEEWETRYIRQCAEDGVVGKCDYKVGTDDIKMFYCYCTDKDKCNSGSSLYSTVFLVFIAIIGQYLSYDL
ncbi:Hypothetical predicted protein [Octopus vulgaris]|nr:Hypothetical predicted protein [Octopus vulgaris]